MKSRSVGNPSTLPISRYEPPDPACVHWLPARLGIVPQAAAQTQPLLPMQGQAAALFGRVDGLIFDMGDVLYDATVWRRWLLQQLGKLGLHAHYRSFFRVWDRDYLAAVHRGERTYDDAFRAFLRDAGLSRGQIDEIAIASRSRKRQLEGTARCLPGVRATLHRLRRAGVQLAVVSDSDLPAEQLEHWLVRLGLGGLFLSVVSSIDLKRTKPDPLCYRTALDEVALAAPRVAFVGHDADELRGAKRIGMRTIAFNFDRDSVADLYLGRFDELLNLVGKCSGDSLRGVA